jgi:hypothetical protein
MKEIISVAIVLMLGLLSATLVASATQFLEERGYEVIPATFATDLADIKAKTDTLPFFPASETTSLLIKGKTDLITADIATQTSLTTVAGNVTAIKTQTDKLTAINTTLENVSEELEIVEQHNHEAQRWFGAYDTNGWANTTYPASSNSILPFKVIVSDTQYAWGNTTVIVAGTESFATMNIAGPPYPATQAYYDTDLIFITDIGITGTWKIRFLSSEWNGSSNTFANAAAAEAAFAYSDLIFKIDSTTNDGTPIVFRTPRVPVGSTIWAKALNNSASGDNTAQRTCGFLYGLHTYPR